MYFTIDKNSYHKENKYISFIKDNSLSRIYYKNKKKIKTYTNVYFCFIDNDKQTFQLKDINNNIVFNDIFKNILISFEKIDNSIIYFKNKNDILLFDIFEKIPRSEALYKFKTNKIIDFETFLFLDENELEEFNIVEIYKLLENNLSLKDFYKYNSIFDYVINNGLKKITNKISFINKKLDLNFIHSFKPAWSEVFKLLENRNNRKIIAIDVNSMFPYCMNQKNYSQINKLIRKEYKNKTEQLEVLSDILNEKISNGISIVEMQLKNNLSEIDKKFIENYNYFQINVENNFYHFNGFEDNIFKMYIHNSEIKVLSNYFNFTILESIYSEDSIQHYLSNTTDKFYEYRMNANNIIEKKVIKTMLVAYHSITNKNIMKKNVLTFKNKDEAVFYFQNYLKIGYLNNWDKLISNQGKRLKDLYIKKIYTNSNKTITIYFNTPYIMDTNQIYSLPSQIMANSRITIFKFLEKIKEFNIKTNSKVEPCYTNIDSIHISIETDKIELFKDFFKNELDQKELGKFKIEGIFDTGLWFDPGRYWLMNKNKDKRYSVVLHKSSVFKDKKNNWVTYKDIFIKDIFGSLIKVRHNLFYSTGYNKLFFKSSQTNIYLKKINIRKLVDSSFYDFIQTLIIKNHSIKKKCFYYFKKRS